MRLVNLTGSRRQSERPDRTTHNSTSPAFIVRHSAAAYHHEKSLSVTMNVPAYPNTGTTAQPRPSRPYRPELRYGVSDPKMPMHQHPYPSTNVGSIYPGSVAGLVKHPYGEDNLDVVDDEYDEYSLQTRPNSGRGTPLGGRRAGDPQSMPPERDVVPGYDRPRAKTEDINGAILAQWRNHGHPMPPPPPPPLGTIPPAPPGTLPSHPSAVPRSGSDASFGPGTVTNNPRTTLRSKFSTTQLRSTYDEERPHQQQQLQQQSTSTFSRSGSQASLTGKPPVNGTRARSSSTPSQYTGPKVVPPPLPTASQWGSGSKSGERNRGSASSQSTGESSDYSPPQTGSPITPFGSNDSSLATTNSTILRSSRSQVFTGPRNDGASPVQPKMLVKVHYGEDLFTLDVPRTIDYDELVAAVTYKVRLCGRRTNGPLRIKYHDEDGDLVSLATTEDVQLAAFDMAGRTLTLYVT
jgi:cell division control protein 24